MVRMPLLLTLLVAVGCDDPSSAPPDADADPEADGGTTVDAAVADAAPPGEPRFDVGPRWGRIEVVEARMWGSRYGFAHASFASPPTVTRIVFYGRVAVHHWQQETMRSGSCRLLEHLPASCDGCVGICVADGVCETLEYASAGQLTFDGLQGPALALEPSPYWYASQGELTDEVFDDDAEIEVAASGADVPAFTVATGAVAPLEADITDDGLTLIDGGDLVVRWTAVAADDPDLRVRLTINANNAGHGQPFEAVIECDTPDTGSVAIPAAMIDAFPPTSTAGICAGSDCPTSILMRYRQANVQVDGAPVDLVVGSQIHFPIVRR